MPKALRQGQAPLRRLFTQGYAAFVHPAPACVRHSAGGSFFFAATKIGIGRGVLSRRGLSPLRRLFTRTMPPSWHPAPACVRHSAGGPFFFAATKIKIGRGPRCRYGHCRRAIPHCSSEDAASIPKSGPEIKNRCTKEGVNRQNLASIP